MDFPKKNIENIMKKPWFSWKSHEKIMKFDVKIFGGTLLYDSKLHLFGTFQA